MVGHAATKTGVRVEEYLAAELVSEIKHEYFDGAVFAMSGATHGHNILTGNIIGELRHALRERPCFVYPPDMRVKVEATGLYTYPDVSVVCGRPRFEDDKKNTLLNPQVIFEVLSESTEAYDRGKKFEHYRSIESLSDYVLLSQNEILVEHFVKQPDDAWTMRELRDGVRLILTSIECESPIADLYLKVFD